jgi:hypothetical protein
VQTSRCTQTWHGLLSHFSRKFFRSDEELGSWTWPAGSLAARDFFRFFRFPRMESRDGASPVGPEVVLACAYISR